MAMAPWTRDNSSMRSRKWWAYSHSNIHPWRNRTNHLRPTTITLTNPCTITLTVCTTPTISLHQTITTTLTISHLTISLMDSMAVMGNMDKDPIIKVRMVNRLIMGLMVDIMGIWVGVRGIGGVGSSEIVRRDAVMWFCVLFWIFYRWVLIGFYKILALFLCRLFLRIKKNFFNLRLIYQWKLLLKKLEIKVKSSESTLFYSYTIFKNQLCPFIG